MESFEKFVGQTLDQRYNIERIVGIGGMAVVFRATDTVAHRTVAIKMLKEDVAKDEAAVKRFINESKAVAMLSHPNIVSIYDVSVSGEWKYIVMEYIEGVTLKSYMSQKGALPLEETISFTEQILRALIHAHSRGIVHRDIKPQNIMLLKNGIIKVADFGIAKLPNAETVTMTDRAIGTVYYISPEQASGLQIDRRSDIYSTGVMLYEMATGRLPFTADSPVTVALMQVQATPDAPTDINPDIPRGLEQIILTAMEKSPDNRFQTAEQMYRWLETLKNNPAVVFKPLAAPIEQKEEPDEKKQRKKKRRQNRNFLDISMFPIILGVAFAFLFACIISAYYLWTEVLFNEERNKSYTMTVENFVGAEYYIGMEEYLATKYYNVSIEFVYDSEMPTGTIISQDPTAKETRVVKPGETQSYCKLYLRVSRGVETFTLPEFLMQDNRTVTDTLTKVYGLVSEIKQEYNTAVDAGLVFKSEPSPGSTVKSGDKITLYVSLGPEQDGRSVVPDFYGMQERDARVAIEKNDLIVGKVTYEYSGERAGNVIRQSHAAYTSVAAGTTIDFTVSLGPEPVTDPPVTDPPETEPPETDPSETDPPEDVTSEDDPPEDDPPEDDITPIFPPEA